MEVVETVIGQGMVFNRITKFNKWLIYKILKNSRVNVYLPDSFLYHKCDLLRLLKAYKILIIKPCYGCLGDDVYRLELADDKEYRLCYKDNFPQFRAVDENVFINKINISIPPKKYLVQQFIKLDQVNSRIYDIRIIVQKNGAGQWAVSGGFSRPTYTNYYLTNFCNKPVSINDILKQKNKLTILTLAKIYSISLQAAQATENVLGLLGEISVDFGLDSQGKPWIIEVNGRTQKSLFVELNDEELIKTAYYKPMEYACFLAKKSP